MTQEELNLRIEKKEKEIEKINKRIAKWTIGMNEEAKQIVSKCCLVYGDPKLQENRLKYEAYKEEHHDDPTVFNPNEWNKGPNIYEAYSAYRDLAEAISTLNKYKLKLDANTNFANMTKIKVIWDFLQDWRKSAYDFFVENAKELYDLRKNYQWAKEEYFKDNPMPAGADWYTQYHLENKFKEDYYSDIHALTYNIYIHNGEVDEKKLNKILDEDVESKYKNLVARITEKAGEIQDASGLYIAPNGEINGNVIGDKNKVYVETITAGGYNIQIKHYRVLVHIVR